MSTFIVRFEPTGRGPRLAVKDLIDMAGVPTTAASRMVAESAPPAAADAALLAGARAADAAIVGKTNLHELAYGASGENPWFGTPVNPLDAALVPGGSSSGSAVAVATGEADVAYGSDTGGSVRIPSACCGTAGLKTTHGRVSLDGVFPLAPSLDTIGPMARDVAGLVLGMQLLEPGFAAGGGADVPRVVGRCRRPDTDPAIDAAVDRTLAAAEVEVVEVELPGWDAAVASGGVWLSADAWRHLGHLLEHGDRLGADVRARLEFGGAITDEQLKEADDGRRAWSAELDEVLGRVEVIAMPTLAVFPPPLGTEDIPLARGTMPVNFAGLPALALPVPTGSRLPASLQIIGRAHSEERLLALGARVEAAVS